MFVFRLASVLRLRIRAEARARLELERILERRRACERRVAVLRAERCRVIAASHARPDASFRDAGIRCERLQNDERLATSERESFAGPLEAARRRLLLAARDRFALERLCEREREKYEARLALLEARELDEANARLQERRRAAEDSWSSSSPIAPSSASIASSISSSETVSGGAMWTTL